MTPHKDMLKAAGYTLKTFAERVLEVYNGDASFEIHLDDEFLEQVQASINLMIGSDSPLWVEGMEFNPQFDDLKDETI